MEYEILEYEILEYERLEYEILEYEILEYETLEYEILEYERLEYEPPPCSPPFPSFLVPTPAGTTQLYDHSTLSEREVVAALCSSCLPQSYSEHCDI